MGLLKDSHYTNILEMMWVQEVIQKRNHQMEDRITQLVIISKQMEKGNTDSEAIRRNCI